MNTYTVMVSEAWRAVPDTVLSTCGADNQPRLQRVKTPQKEKKIKKKLHTHNNDILVCVNENINYATTMFFFIVYTRNNALFKTGNVGFGVC